MHCSVPFEHPKPNIPCYVFRSEIPVIPPGICATALRDAKSYGFCCAFFNGSPSDHEGFGVWKAVLMTACWTECTPPLMLKQWNTNHSDVDGCAQCCCLLPTGWAALSWQSIDSSQENKELWASLASQRGWGTAAGVTCRSVEPGVGGTL